MKTLGCVIYLWKIFVLRLVNRLQSSLIALRLLWKIVMLPKFFYTTTTWRLTDL